MNRKLKRRAMFGIASGAAAVLVTTLLIGRPNDPVDAQLMVPQAQSFESDIPKPPPATVSVILPSAPIDTTASTPSPKPRQSVMTPRPTSATPTPVAVDFQAEDAKIHNGQVQVNHAGFTGSGFVDYAAAAGGSVEWTVAASATTGTDVVFRFANGSAEARPMAVTVNGTLVAFVAFPVTNGWEDWRTLTVHVNLPTGTNKIKAIAATGNGGPNLDKITLT